jgi:hypothetical protein
VITVEIEDIPLMLDVIDTYIEGIKEAKEASMVDDRTLDTMESLLDSMSLYDQNLVTLLRLKEVLIIGKSKEERKRWFRSR